MKGETRNKMISGAVDLLRRRGVNATSVREVVRHSGTPRGSIRHHFPQGKQQLVQEALNAAGEAASQPLAALVQRAGVQAGLRAFIAGWRSILEDSQFEAGCPVLAVAVEQYIGEDGFPDAQAQDVLLANCASIFGDWGQILSEGLTREGVGATRAQSLATLIVAAVEGSVALCRAAGHADPLLKVEEELLSVLESVIPN